MTLNTTVPVGHDLVSVSEKLNRLLVREVVDGSPEIMRISGFHEGCLFCLKLSRQRKIRGQQLLEQSKGSCWARGNFLYQGRKLFLVTAILNHVVDDPNCFGLTGIEFATLEHKGKSARGPSFCRRYQLPPQSGTVASRS